MSDGQLLLIALGVLTFYECLRWVPVRVWLFQGVGGNSWRAARPWETLRTRGRGFVMLMPLPPFEPHVVTAAWPCAPHEAGLCVWHDDSGVAQHVPWDQVRARAEGAMLHLTAELRVPCVHAANAEAWAARVNAWMSQSQGERESAFLKQATDMLDPHPVITAASSLSRSTRWLRRLGATIFYWCFFMLPAVYWRFADAWPTWAAALVLLALMSIQAILVARVVRSDARLRKGSIQHLFSAALYPPASMRAADWICSLLTPETHPLAALKAWGTEEELKKVAGRWWREARWPLGKFPMRPWTGPEVEALSRFLKMHGLHPDGFEEPPILPEDCTRWCPRCHTTYHNVATECVDCVGIKLMS